MMKIGLSILAAILLSVPAQVAKAQNEQSPTVLPKAVVLTMAPTMPSFRASEPILFRATVKNISGTNYGFILMHTNLLLRITVYDSDGKKVQESGAFATGHPTMPRCCPFPAGSTIALKDLNGSEDLDLAHWGYDNLAPGTYKVTAVLKGILQATGPDDVEFLTSDEHGQTSASFEVVVRPG